LITTKDAILLCNKEMAEEVKKIVDYLEQQNRQDLL